MNVWRNKRRARNAARLDAVVRYADGRERAFGDGLLADSLVLALECECGRRDCEETLAMFARGYEAVRQAGARVVCSGHEDASEWVAAGGDGFSVIEQRYVA